jgi:hypothetical protein
MESISRRNVLAATAAGGLLTAASVAAAETVEGIPQPRRPDHGGTDPGPRNLMRDGQNPDLLVPPSTDHGSLPNLRLSFSDASTGLFRGGWTRQVSVREFGVATTISGTNMRLNCGGPSRFARRLSVRHHPNRCSTRTERDSGPVPGSPHHPVTCRWLCALCIASIRRTRARLPA